MEPIVDILVLGATGCTGKCIARYLCTHPQRTAFTLGFAARSPSKLMKLVTELATPSDDIRTFTVDVTDQSTVVSAVRQARVVINAVGPYSLWGSPVVRACVHHGVHYVDLTGEVAWVKRVVIEEDYAATKSGSIIVPACGLSSVPADILTFLANRTLKAHAGRFAFVDHSISAWKCENMIVSGGSVHSALTTIFDTPREKLREAMQDFALSPVVGVQYPRPRAVYALPSTTLPTLGSWNVMALMDLPVVQRSWGLFELAARRAQSELAPPKLSLSVAEAEKMRYGPSFKYEQFMVYSGLLQSYMVSMILATFIFVLIKFPFVPQLVRKLMPKPGEGLPERVLEDGSVEVINVTQSTPGPDGTITTIRSTLHGVGEPGHVVTAVLVSECALTLILDAPSLPALAKEGGVLTPMTAFGDVLIERLNNCGRIRIASEVIEAYL
ncbi:hypothetical protein HYDPIDRAFT_110316 [Hydnomerulius pinastri MD-312]|nr:hypothetical protein HYDPIDRAFT_110316 [Hydnomerulius pinastri MD-312]